MLLVLEDFYGEASNKEAELQAFIDGCNMCRSRAI